MIPVSRKSGGIQLMNRNPTSSPVTDGYRLWADARDRTTLAKGLARPIRAEKEISSIGE
jgi:hypothetical protein